MAIPTTLYDYMNERYMGQDELRQKLLNEQFLAMQNRQLMNAYGKQEPAPIPNPEPNPVLLLLE